jgi:hypothetical protein
VAEFKVIAKITNRLAYDPNQEEVFRAFVFRSLNEDLYKYEKIDFDKSGDIGSATIVFQQGVIQNDEGFLVCVAAFDDDGSMESWFKIATNHPGTTARGSNIRCIFQPRQSTTYWLNLLCESLAKNESARKCLTYELVNRDRRNLILYSST